ncbi:hypothetical protein G159_19930 [Planococcus glaciei CHR43]|uniref:hypothetical protein n=1 Tax=Planococcus glaciei TaxID=459472 RepID=UPI0003DF2860|nr:hypothetical protein [Planococcus glaciei]ETP66939.1 hypothetical protein G159_19930 [Planococcus glaciei CHR43]
MYVHNSKFLKTAILQGVMSALTKGDEHQEPFMNDFIKALYMFAEKQREKQYNQDS